MGIYFLDSNNGWVVGVGGPIIRTTNGGSSWSLSTSDAQELRNVQFVNEDEGWAVGYGSVILHSIDGGNSLISQNSNTSLKLFGVSFVNNIQGWVTGQNGTILTTLNGGIPVELVSFLAEQFEDGIKLSWITATGLNNRGFDVERKLNNEWELIGFVEGSGTSTETQYYNFSDDITQINSIRKVFYRLKQLDFDGAFEYLEEVEVSLDKPLDYSLQQNYPNPFNPSTKIKFHIAEDSYVRLEIFDMLGNEVTTLIAEELPIGRYDVEFDASDLSSGTYFYKLSSNEFQEVKKMILLK